MFQHFALKRVLALSWDITRRRMRNSDHRLTLCERTVVRKLRNFLKPRLDKLLVDRGFVASRERAQALILAGKVLVNEQKIDKSGAQVEEESAIRLLGEDLKFVSRGGLKLERALQYWNIDLRGRTCLDVGHSTGGFTDCMLQHGAARVVAVDTGYGQMDFKLRQDIACTCSRKRTLAI